MGVCQAVGIVQRAHRHRGRGQDEPLKCGASEEVCPAVTGEPSRDVGFENSRPSTQASADALWCAYSRGGFRSGQLQPGGRESRSGDSSSCCCGSTTTTTTTTIAGSLLQEQKIELLNIQIVLPGGHEISQLDEDKLLRDLQEFSGHGDISLQEQKGDLWHLRKTLQGGHDILQLDEGKLL